MLTIPTRAKFVEQSIVGSKYGSRLVREFSEAMTLALENGQRSIVFSFDPDSFKDNNLKLINGLFIEYLAIKKYMISDINSSRFRVRLI